MTRRSFPRRKGMATLEYVMATAVIVPISAALFYMMVRAFKLLYYLSSILLGWLVF